MESKKVLLCLAHMSGNEMKYIQEAFDTNWVVPLGPNVDGFEDDLEKFIGGKHSVVALSSGTSAIHLALVALGVGLGDEVICQSFTFDASANPVVYQGATPIFIDSEEKTWNMDPNLLEDAIKDRIKKRVRSQRLLSLFIYMVCLLISMRLWISPIVMKFLLLRMQQKLLAQLTRDKYAVHLALSVL